jgi:hypothetical protein
VPYEKFLQQFYCLHSIFISAFFIVIAPVPDAAKLAANRYSFLLSTSQNAITRIFNTDFLATKQSWLSSNILKF